MNQMNISITEGLAGYVRNQVKSGRYNNASEVVRDALRRMQDEDARTLRVAEPTTEDVLANLTQAQVDAIRVRVRQGIANMKDGHFTEYAGREGLKKLADTVKERGRKRLQAAASRA